MDIAEAASGPEKDNAGQASGIDDAITAALDASEARDLSSLLKGDEGSNSNESAGDDATSEDAAHAAGTSEDTGEPQALSAPKHWPEADKQAFARLPKEGQEIALKLAKNLEGGFTRKSQELSDKGRFADSIRGLFDDTTRQQIQAAGTDEFGYIRYLHSLQQTASRDPVGYLKWAMQRLGVTPEKLFGPQVQQQTGQPQGQQPDPLADLLVDPKVSQLEAKLAALQNVIETEQRQKAEAERARVVNITNSLNTQIRSFREALDDHGQLMYPHFDAVQKHMGALMDTDPDLAQMQDGPEKLQKAYEMAVWARPDLRQSFIEAEAQKKVQEAQKKREAERAKKATSVKPAAGVVATRPKAKSLDDAINEAVGKHGL